MATETYVHDNTEVVKTGKTAERTLKSGKVDQLIEVTPSDKMTGTWKKWVRIQELFIVKGE